MPYRSRRTLLAAITALSLHATERAAPAQTPTGTLPSNCLDQVVAPESMWLTCADGGFYAEGLVWTDWGSQQASATGTAHINTCEPSCADGNFETSPITLTADRLTVCQLGAPQYTRVAYTFPDDSPFAPETPITGYPAVDFPCPRKPHADPRIRGMRLRLTGHNPGPAYFVRVHLRLRVCAVRGRSLAVLDETLRLSGRTFARYNRTLRFRQTKNCNTRFFRWKLRHEFFGVGTYKVTAAVWDRDFQISKTVSRKKVTLD